MTSPAALMRWDAAAERDGSATDGSRKAQHADAIPGEPSRPHVLVVEDNEEIRRSLIRGFEEHGFDVAGVAAGRDAFSPSQVAPPDIVVLDRLLPDGEGLDFLARWRAGGMTAPVIVLSALTSVEDRVAGLERGADDYLPKPFAFAELLARVRALLRRGGEAALVLEVADLRLDLRTREIVRAGRKIDLSGAQFRLLEFLMRHAGETVSRKMILDHVWEPGVEAVTNVVDVYINRLRNKLDKGAARPLIHTVRGLGYVLREG